MGKTTICYGLIKSFSRKRKPYISFLILWILLVFLTFTEVYRGSSKGCPCPKDRAPKPGNSLIKRIFYPASVKDTIDGFLKKAQTDAFLLQRILQQNFLHNNSREIIRCFLTGKKYNGFSSELNETTVTLTDYDLNSDVIVFLHIQKTGGTFFNNRLVSYRRFLPFPCNCAVHPCKCKTASGNVWLYASRFSGWPCGLHADWTQLHRCLPEMLDSMEGKQRKRRYFYISQLREPVRRYFSEVKHQNKGKHWQDAILGCGSGVADWRDIRPCFHGKSWSGVSLDEFLACPHNLATNRQARMLADLTLTYCYRNYEDKNLKIIRAHSWVKSAIENLRSMEYFGLMEEPERSDKLFHKVFGFDLRDSNARKGLVEETIKITEQQFLQIIRLTELDIHVYMFAKELLYKRSGE